MNMLIGVLIICLFPFHSTCKADLTPLSVVINPHSHTGIFNDPNPQTTIGRDLANISYGFVSVKLYSGPVPDVKIERLSRENPDISLSVVNTAEAAVVPDPSDIRGFERLCNAVSDAARLDDLKPFIVDKNIELLKAKVKAGVSEHVVLAMFQVMRPQKIHIIDSRVEAGWAEFSVTGDSTLGRMQGKVHMLKAEGTWKIDEEAWYASKHPDRRDNLMVSVFNGLSDPQQYIYPDRKGGLSVISSGDAVKKRVLQLTKISNHRRRQAFMFVFFMDKAKADTARAAVTQDDRRGRMHVLGPKRVFPQQHVIEDQYPVDISVARYDDGYAPEELNLVVPNGKPREVAVSWLWSF